MSEIEDTIIKSVESPATALESSVDDVKTLATVEDGEKAASVVEKEDEASKVFNLRPEIIYHISDFDGPLDMLVTMIKDAKIDIEKLFISEVTGQYVEIIKNTPKEELDFEYAGEFITVAAELVWLKSFRSLPKEDDEPLDEDDPEYLRQQFILKVKEYALMKEQAEKLRDKETINRFYREPTYTDKDYRVSLTNFSLPKLVDAFAHVLANADRMGQDNMPKKVLKDRFSVHDQMLHIRALAAVSGQLTFTSLFEDDFDRNDIVTTFLAVLELLKYQKLRAEQNEPFGEIVLYSVASDDTNEELVFNEEDTNEQY